MVAEREAELEGQITLDELLAEMGEAPLLYVPEVQPEQASPLPAPSSGP